MGAHKTLPSLPFLIAVARTPRHLEMDLNTQRFRAAGATGGRSLSCPVEQALRDAGLSVQHIDRLVFVGGPTRMPMVRSFFETIFGRQAEMGVDPMECVAHGAAIQAGVLNGTPPKTASAVRRQSS